MAHVTDGHALGNRLDQLRPPVILTAPSVPGSSRSWLTGTGMVVALVLLGIGLRGVALRSDRNLWIDESMLALNLIERSPARLLEPLDWNQGAPVGFLLLVKAAIT